MTKAKSVFICQQCGYESSRWLGKCSNCGKWNSMVETLVSPKAESLKLKTGSSNVKPQKLSQLSLQKITRIKTNIDEFDQILGGGIITGQVILVAGSPGIGKSTLLLQIADILSKTLYASGEESLNQIGIRAKRLGVKSKSLNVVEATDIDSIVDVANNFKPKALIIDSIQTMTTSDLTGMAGSVGQVRECAFRLVRFAKSTNTPTFIVGHVTKEGSVAGPSLLAHIVDTVLWFEGDKNLTYRMIRAYKNRFGPTDEVGVFEMKEKGLMSLHNSEKLFLNEAKDNVSGRAVSSLMQGSRPVLLEVEALVVPSKLAFPKRIAGGIDPKRLELLIAVLIKHCKMPLYEYDVFVNVTGGISAKTPAIDLAICLSITSSFYDKPLSRDIIAIGEVGLLGEIRKVNGQEKMVKAARKLGYQEINNLSTISALLKKFPRIDSI